MYIDIVEFNNWLRRLIALNNFIIVIWSISWFVSFWLMLKRRGKNGPTKALLIKFIATAIFHTYLAVGFLYLSSPYVHPVRNTALLLIGWLGSALIIVSYFALQWKFK